MQYSTVQGSSDSCCVGNVYGPYNLEGLRHHRPVIIVGCFAALVVRTHGAVSNLAGVSYCVVDGDMPGHPAHLTLMFAGRFQGAAVAIAVAAVCYASCAVVSQVLAIVLKHLSLIDAF